MAEPESYTGFKVYKYYSNRSSYNRNHSRRSRNEYVVEALFGNDEETLPNSKTSKLLKKLKSLQQISDAFFQRIKLEPDVLESFKRVLGASFEHGTIDYESFLDSEQRNHFTLLKVSFETMSRNYEKIMDLENQIHTLTDENFSLHSYVSDVQDEMERLRQFASDCNELRVSELGIQSEEYQMLYDKYSSLQDELKNVLHKNYKLEKQISQILEREREDRRSRSNIHRELTGGDQYESGNHGVGEYETDLFHPEFKLPYDMDLFEPILDENKYQSKLEDYRKRIEELKRSNNVLFDENIKLKKISQEKFGPDKFVTLSLLFNQITKSFNKLFQEQNEAEIIKNESGLYKKFNMLVYDAKINTLDYENRTYSERLMEMEELLKMETLGRFSLESIVSQLKMELHQSQQVYLKLENMNTSVLTNEHELDLIKTNRDVLSEQLNRMKHMVTNLTQEKHELSGKIFNLEYTNDTLKKEVEVMKDQLKKLEHLLTDQMEDRFDFKDKITNIQLQADSKILKDKLVRLKVKLDEVQLENTNLATNTVEFKNNLERLRRENSELSKKIAMAAKNESKLTTEMQHLMNEVNGLKASLETGSVNMRNMSNDMGLMTRKLFEKDLQLSSLEAKKDMIASVLTEFAAKLNRCKVNTVNLEELKNIDIKSLNYSELVQILTNASVVNVNATVYSNSMGTISNNGSTSGLHHSITHSNGMTGVHHITHSNSISGVHHANAHTNSMSLYNNGTSNVVPPNSTVRNREYRGSGEGHEGGSLSIGESMDDELMRNLTNLINFNEFLSTLCVNLAKQLGTLTNNTLNVTDFPNIYETFKMELVDVDAFKNECLIKINDLESKISNLERVNSELGEKHIWEKSIVRVRENYEKSLTNYKLMLKECRHLLKLNETALDALRSENARLLSDCSGAANVMVEYETKLSDSTQELVQIKELIFTLLPNELKINANRETPIKSIELLTNYLNNISIIDTIGSANNVIVGSRNKSRYNGSVDDNYGNVGMNVSSSSNLVANYGIGGRRNDHASRGSNTLGIHLGNVNDNNDHPMDEHGSATAGINYQGSHSNYPGSSNTNSYPANTNSYQINNINYQANTHVINSTSDPISNSNNDTRMDGVDNVNVANRDGTQYDGGRSLNQHTAGTARNRDGSSGVVGGSSGNGTNHELNKEILIEKEQQLNNKQQQLDDIYDDINYYCKLIVDEIKSQLTSDKQIDTDYESTNSNHDIVSDGTLSEYKDEDYVVDRFEEILNLLNKLYYYNNYANNSNGSNGYVGYSKKKEELYMNGIEKSRIVLDMNVIKSINNFVGTLKRYYSTYNKQNMFVLDDLEYHFESISTIMDSESKFKTFTINLTKLLNLAGEFIYEQLTETTENINQMVKQLKDNEKAIQKLEHMNMAKDQQLKSTKYEINDLKLQIENYQQMYMKEKSRSQEINMSMNKCENEMGMLKRELDENKRKNEKLVLLVKEYQQIVRLLRS